MKWIASVIFNGGGSVSQVGFDDKTEAEEALVELVAKHSGTQPGYCCGVEEATVEEWSNAREQ